MGLFNFFSKKRKRQPSVKIEMNVIGSYDQEYFRLLNEKPELSDFTGRSWNYPKFTDQFKTDERFRLRELLLFVWWGNTKNGRSSTTRIPKYFFETYNLDTVRLTMQFKRLGWLTEEKDKILLTDKGSQIYKKYKDLWDLHSFKNLPICLDEDFENYDKEELTINYYKTMIEFLKAEAVHNARMIHYFNQNPNVEDIGNQRIYHTTHRDSNLLEIKNLEEKLAILTDNDYYLQ